MQILASLPVNRGKTLSKKIHIDRRERICVYFGIHETHVPQWTLFEVGIGDQLSTFAELTETIYCICMVFALWSNEFNEAIDERMLALTQMTQTF
jgi:hypothetical protein